MYRNLYYLDPSGFDFVNTLNNVETIVKSRLDQDKINHNIGGRSTIVLLVPVSVPSSGDSSTISNKRDYFKQYIPGIYLFILEINFNKFYLLN